MKRFLYLTLNPEALISSMLPPLEFGNYMAVGSSKKSHGQSIFFEVDQNIASDYLPFDFIEEKCIPHTDGSPKRSLFLSIYKVLEITPLESLKGLYLATNDGRVLELQRAPYDPGKEEEDVLHLYQELSPVTPRIVSTLAPSKFAHFVTNRANNVYLPKIVFVELRLDELAVNPENGSVEDLPYPNIEHLRTCLTRLQQDKEKRTKTALRYFQGDLMYRTCKNGFFVGSQGTFLFYPFPSVEELQEKHYVWWKSAITISF
ncbi:MAG TPA: hypothetical protein VJL89_00510 [Thermodesulfovibrionia bacterium]|nr:hypothetical protein [Thermodesulfovibrionia bacterium]